MAIAINIYSDSDSADACSAYSTGAMHFGGGGGGGGGGDGDGDGDDDDDDDDDDGGGGGPNWSLLLQALRRLSTADQSNCILYQAQLQLCVGTVLSRVVVVAGWTQASLFQASTCIFFVF